MDFNDKLNRISRLHLQNIAPPNYYKPVTRRNNVFCRVKRNSAVLSNLSNSKDKIEQVYKSYVLNEQDISVQGSQQGKKSFEKLKSSMNSNHLVSSNKKQINNKLNQSVLPQIRKSKDMIFTSPSKSLVYDDTKNSSHNEIEGTRIGVLSSKEILKKYQVKKIRQELEKKQFFDDYIKNLKNGDYDIDDDYEDESLVEKKMLSLGRPLMSSGNLNESKKQMNLSESQQKLTELLGNKLTDRDYIEYNVKLFQKRDINKKKFFQRYHNILKNQRDAVTLK